jgi:uncharacterized protein YcfJ
MAILRRSDTAAHHDRRHRHAAVQPQLEPVDERRVREHAIGGAVGGAVGGALAVGNVGWSMCSLRERR